MWVEWFSKFYHGKGTPFKPKLLFDWEVYGVQPQYLETVQVVSKQNSV